MAKKIAGSMTVYGRPDLTVTITTPLTKTTIYISGHTQPCQQTLILKLLNSQQKPTGTDNANLYNKICWQFWINNARRRQNVQEQRYCHCLWENWSHQIYKRRTMDKRSIDSSHEKALIHITRIIRAQEALDPYSRIANRVFLVRYMKFGTLYDAAFTRTPNSLDA